MCPDSTILALRLREKAGIQRQKKSLIIPGLTNDLLYGLR